MRKHMPIKYAEELRKKIPEPQNNKDTRMLIYDPEFSR